MARKILALVAVGIMVLAGCGGPQHGYVMGKTIVPPMDWIWLMPVTVGKTIILVPINEHSDECPQLTLADDPQNHPSKTKQICVTQLVYQNTAVGSFYTEQGK